MTRCPLAFLFGVLPTPITFQYFTIVDRSDRWSLNQCLLQLKICPVDNHSLSSFRFIYFLPPDGLKCELLENIITDCESNVVTGLDSSNSLPDGDRCLYCFISQSEMLGKTISKMFSLLQEHPAVGLSPILFYF